MVQKLRAKMEIILEYCADKPYAYAEWIVDPITYEIGYEIGRDHSASITPTLAVERLQHEIEIWSN